MSNNSQPIISLINEQPRTISADVAAYFGKQHKDVLKLIRNIMISCPADFCERNFAPTEIFVKVPASGGLRKDPAFSLTKDAFMLVVMGLTGSKAMNCKIAYIEAFNCMEAELTAPKALPEPEPKVRRGRNTLPAPNPVERQVAIIFEKVRFYIREIAEAEKQASDLLVKGRSIRDSEDNKAFHNFNIHVACTSSALWSALDFNLRAIEDSIKARLAAIRS